MHDGCTGATGSGMEVLQKVRMKGFSDKAMPMVQTFDCVACETEIQMTTLEYKCPTCHMVYAVTPCSAHDQSRIQAVGKHV